MITISMLIYTVKVFLNAGAVHSSEMEVDPSLSTKERIEFTTRVLKDLVHRHGARSIWKVWVQVPTEAGHTTLIYTCTGTSLVHTDSTVFDYNLI